MSLELIDRKGKYPLRSWNKERARDRAQSSAKNYRAEIPEQSATRWLQKRVVHALGQKRHLKRVAGSGHQHQHIE